MQLTQNLPDVFKFSIYRQVSDFLRAGQVFLKMADDIVTSEQNA